MWCLNSEVVEDKNARTFSDYVQELENESLSDEFNELAAKNNC